MLRKIEELQKLSQSVDIINDLKYQKMVALKKVMEESNLPQGVWATQEATNGWNEIEENTWELLKTVSNDYKLLVLWAQSYIKISNIEKIPFVFEVMAKVFENSLILKDKEKEHAIDILNYIDKHVTIALKLMNINIDSSQILWNSIEKFNKELYGQFYSMLNSIKDNAIEKLQNIASELKQNMELIYNQLGTEYANAFSQLNHMVSVFNDFIWFRTDISFQKEEEQAHEEPEEEQNELKNFAYYRNIAFNAIDEGTQILDRIEPQSIVLPFLKKVLKWKDLSLLEIFDDLGDANQIEAFIKILKENKPTIDKNS